METDSHIPPGHTRKALNRTIVGWKQDAQSRRRWPGVPLNRTIVGWKQLRTFRTASVSQLFKSHHSGMETRLEQCRVARSGPL